MVFCSYKRRSLWRGYYFGIKFYEFLLDYEVNEETLLFTRSMVFLPSFVSRKYVFYTGKEVVQGSISKKRVHMKVGQISITKFIGSRIHRTVQVRKSSSKYKKNGGKFKGLKKK